MHKVTYLHLRSKTFSGWLNGGCKSQDWAAITFLTMATLDHTIAQTIIEHHLGLRPGDKTRYSNAILFDDKIYFIRGNNLFVAYSPVPHNHN